MVVINVNIAEQRHESRKLFRDKKLRTTVWTNVLGVERGFSYAFLRMAFLTSFCLFILI
jgi:hypothetical protein